MQLVNGTNGGAGGGGGGESETCVWWKYFVGHVINTNVLPEVAESVDFTDRLHRISIALEAMRPDDREWVRLTLSEYLFDALSCYMVSMPAGTLDLLRRIRLHLSGAANIRGIMYVFANQPTYVDVPHFAVLVDAWGEHGEHGDEMDEFTTSAHKIMLYVLRATLQPERVQWYLGLGEGIDSLFSETVGGGEVLIGAVLALMERCTKAGQPTTKSDEFATGLDEVIHVKKTAPRDEGGGE